MRTRNFAQKMQLALKKSILAFIELLISFSGLILFLGARNYEMAGSLIESRSFLSGLSDELHGVHRVPDLKRRMGCSSGERPGRPFHESGNSVENCDQ
jgi:hypothetical protein